MPNNILPPARGQIITAEYMRGLVDAAQADTATTQQLKGFVSSRHTALAGIPATTKQTAFEAEPYPGQGDYVLVGKHRDDVLYPLVDTIMVFDPSTQGATALTKTTAESVQIAATSWIYYEILRTNAGAYTATLKASTAWPPTADTPSDLYALIAYAQWDSVRSIVGAVYQVQSEPCIVVTPRPYLPAFAPLYIDASGTRKVRVTAGRVVDFAGNATTVAAADFALNVAASVWVQATQGTGDATPTVNTTIQSGSYSGHWSLSGSTYTYRWLLGSIASNVYTPARQGDIYAGVLVPTLKNSIEYDGSRIQLVNDEDSPTNGKLYGKVTTKGWHTLEAHLKLLASYDAGKVMIPVSNMGTISWVEVGTCT